MKLLYVIPDMETGGAQRLLTDMLRRMAMQPDTQITLAIYTTLSNPSHLLQSILNLPAIRVISLDIPLSGRASLNPLIRRKAIRRLRPLIQEADLCHAHLFPALYDVVRAAKGSKTKLVFTEHSTDNKRRHIPIIRHIERRLYARYDSVVSVSQAAHHALEKWLDLKYVPKNLHVIENGIDTRRFLGKRSDIDKHNSFDYPLPENSDELMERFYQGISGEMDIRMAKARINRVSEIYGREGLPILMVSRFVKSKNQEALIKAFHLLMTDPEYSAIRRYAHPFLAFAGEGPTIERCRALAKTLSISDDVLFLGERNDIPRLLAAAAIGVQLSNWEGVGLTALEIMASGLPVVASAIPGLRNTVRDAALLTPNDPKDIAMALASILMPMSPEDFNDILVRIHRGLKIALRHDISRTLDAYRDLYLRLLR